jgi:hypothetical protein
MALMQSTFVIISVAVALIVAIAVLTNLAPTANQFACPAPAAGDNDLTTKLKNGCKIFQDMGGILLVIVPIIAAAVVILLYTRGAF